MLLRDLDDVLFRDVGGKIAEDGRYKNAEINTDDASKVEGNIS